MSYISAIRQREKVIVWERRSDNVRVAVPYDAPWYFYDYNENGSYKNMYGNKLSKYEFDSRQEFNEAKDNLIEFKHIEKDNIISAKRYSDMKDNDFQLGTTLSGNYKQSKYLHESDIAPELKILSEHYYKKKTPKLHLTGYDIEVDYTDVGFPRPVLDFNPEDYRGDFTPVADTPYAPINSISLYNFWENKNYLIAVPPEGITAEEIDVDEFMESIQEIEPLDLPTTLEFFNTERELLLRFLDIIHDSDLIFGWNSDTFDNPYAAQRIEIVLGQKHFKRLSFEHGKLPIYKTMEMFGEDRPTVEFSGRIATDYMDLYKKFSFEEKPSYKLESIAEEELPKMRKLEYDGSLYELYRKDFKKFVRYNIRDTEILEGFESKLGFLQLASDLYHNTTGLYPHVFGTLKNTELSIINYCHYECDNIIVNDNEVSSSDDTIEGAYVIDPKVGQHDKIASIDMTSLYPSAIRSNNISPEKIIGQFKNNKGDFAHIKNKSNELITLLFDIHLETTETELTLEAYKWGYLFKSKNWSISGYGTVFDLNGQGILPGLLEYWFIGRKKKKTLSFEYYQKSEIEGIDNKEELLELSDYYDRLQMVDKLSLVSAYGALCNNYFRFYDLRLGASTTATGQELLKHQTAQTNLLLRGKYDMFGEAIIYGDTDSVFCDTIVNYNNNLEDTIENIFNDLPLKNVIGDKEYAIPSDTFEVMSYDHENNTPVMDEALCVYRRKVHKEQWSVEDINGNVTRYTRDHSVMVERNGELMECKPMDILDTDLLITLEEIL